ncbi:MAG: hypothetical protein IJW69_01275 [Clostridia bacterium]|nr:hypothetical protein [Clostridia bacterium]
MLYPLVKFQNRLRCGESFDQTFSKVCVGGGREALLARRNERNLLDGLSLVLSLAYCSKERTERAFSMLHVLIHSVLFLGYVAARKSTKKNGVFCGAQPHAPQTFGKV